MQRAWLMASACALSMATAVQAQEAQSAASEAAQNGEGEIIVTATRRAQALSDVPIAVSAVTSENLANSGASDIRQLNQLSPSLLVSSTSSEAIGGVARIRGIGTIGDNPGLESSVAVFVDGVYRSRSAVALTELGAVDRIEVLRGPQGTLFGRNASAGLIHVITAQPKFENAGTAEFSYGNYDYWRAQVGLTGPISEKVAYRIDGVMLKRDGFMQEGTYAGSTGRRFNDRDRWMTRAQLLLKPSDDLSVRIIGDYSDRDEQCCAGAYLPPRNVTRDGSGNLVFSPSTVAGAMGALGGVFPQPWQDRKVAVTPGRDYRQDVRDWGLSAEINYDFETMKLTSISAYRDNLYKRGQDADFNNLDILYRPNDGSDQMRFQTFTQELRLQGSAFEDRLDWLVGGYYAHEKLGMTSKLSFGADFDRYMTSLVRTSLPTFPGFSFLRPTVVALMKSQAPEAVWGTIDTVIAPLITNISPGANTGINDRYDQKSRNYALFTHNIFKVTDSVSLTLGARYTNERKELDATFRSTVPDGQAQMRQTIVNLSTLAATQQALAPLLTPIITQLTALARSPLPLYGILSSYNGTLNDSVRKEDEWTGTAVLSWKPSEDLLTYASYSKGYKAGGFNVDRSVLNAATPNLNQMQFSPEKVDSYEVGAKFDGSKVDVNVAVFRQDFEDFQLNIFQGLTFLVENIGGCTQLAGGANADSDLDATTGACTGKRKAGVRSEGVELEIFARPMPDVSVNLGYTYADTKYKKDLVGTNGAPLSTALFQLPGRALANAPKHVVTGSAGWTPDIGSSGLSGLLYADFRYQGKINTGSDLNIEKEQKDVMVVNARIGVRGPDQRWSLEFWAQNLFNTDYTQIAFNAPGQGSGETRAVAQGLQSSASRLYGVFPAEPRTYGVTVRTQF